MESDYIKPVGQTSEHFSWQRFGMRLGLAPDYLIQALWTYATDHV